MAKNPGRIKPLSEGHLVIKEEAVTRLASHEVVVASGEVTSHAFTLDGVASGTYELSASVADGGRLEVAVRGSVAPRQAIKFIVRITGGGEIAIDRTPKCIGQGAAYSVETVGIIEQNAKIHVSDSVRLSEDSSVALLRSRLVFKDQASGDVRAFMHVSKEAHGVVAKEDLRTLVLGDANRVQCIPELRVETKDCIATHASTIARPQKDQLQYLAAHGFTKSQAEAYIAEAFTRSV